MLQLVNVDTPPPPLTAAAIGCVRLCEWASDRSWEFEFRARPKASDIGSCPHRRKTQPANSRMWRFWCDVSFRWNKGALWMCGLAPPGGGNWAQISARTRKASIIFPRQRGRSVVTCVCVWGCVCRICVIWVKERMDGFTFLPRIVEVARDGVI